MNMSVWAWVVVLSGDAVMFLLLAPIIPMHPYPYCTRIEGLGSASAYLLNNGLVYVLGRFEWLSPPLSNFICF